MSIIRNFLTDPTLKKLDVDAAERLDLHQKVLQQKPMLREVFSDFHHSCKRLAERYLYPEGLEIEIGAGIAPMRESYPGVLATDIVFSPYLDRVLNAEAMDIEDHCIRVFYGQNCFHHFPHPDLFFAELNRTLKPGGGAILIEPFYGPCSRFLYKRLFKSEGFDPHYNSWETPASGPMNGANQALSYIVFVRDREEFERKNPGLEIAHMEVCNNYIRYLTSGGLNFRQLLPDALTPALKLIEKLLYPARHLFALHHIIVIRKKP
ncbi:class I SAM-dependent methyltransferase [Pseudomonas sp. MWU13-2105]|uniref:class I SAM-dependent methyltransferase n=1 Tax=Pseudomonas sp. MWU13-2105 TaxID=2935074 RepID=UPI00200E3C09|nr:methyltransferase domain-containing protein [Pseudomonas sp. MWU13-2105]